MPLEHKPWVRVGASPPSITRGPLFAKGFAAKGAGATTAAPLKDKPWVSTEKKDTEAEATFAALLEKSRDIRDYLSPSVTPEVLADAGCGRATWW